MFAKMLVLSAEKLSTFYCQLFNMVLLKVKQN